MSKVEQQDDAEHHRVAKSDERVDAAQLETIQHLRQKRHGKHFPSSRIRQRPIPSTTTLGEAAGPDVPHYKEAPRGDVWSRLGAKKLELRATNPGALALDGLVDLLGTVLEGDDERGLDWVASTGVGDGSGDAVDAARGDGVDDGLLVLIGASLAASALSGGDAVAENHVD